MLQKVCFHNVKKNQRVVLAKQLPVAQGFGNSSLINQDVRGDITSQGFEQGRLKVKFYTHLAGTQNVEFNEFSAAGYLLTDV